VLSIWGSKGTGEGQFNDPTSVAVDPRNNRVYVADPIKPPDTSIRLEREISHQWPVPEWGQSVGFEDWPSIHNRSALRVERTYELVLVR